MPPTFPAPPARTLPLPTDEAERLRSLYDSPDPAHLRARVAALRAAGWSLSEVAAAFNPPLARSTIRSWEVAARTSSAPASAPTLPLDPVPRRPARATPNADLRARSGRPHPRPSVSASAPASAPAHLSPDRAALIAELAPRAARLRAGTSSTSDARRASDELDRLVVTSLREGVTVAELARAAGVSHRAMSTRAQRATATLPPHPAPTPPVTPSTPSAHSEEAPA